MSLYSVFKAAIAGIKNTVTGLVEYDSISVAQSLPRVHDTLSALLLNGVVPRCQTISDLQVLPATDAKMALLEKRGIFINEPLSGGLEHYQAIDGSYWNFYASMQMQDLVFGIPGSGEVPIWNTSTNRPEWGSIAVGGGSSWASITGKPTLVTQFGIPGAGANHNVGVSAHPGDGNIHLTPNGAGLATGSNGTVFINKSIPNMKVVEDSFISTNRTSLRTAAVDFNVRRCVIIGDPGPLDSFFVGNDLEDLIIIGNNGNPTYTRAKDGVVWLQGNGAGRNIQFPDPTGFGSLATFGVNGLTNSGPTALNGLVTLGADMTSIWNATFNGLTVNASMKMAAGFPRYASLVAAQGSMVAGSVFINTGANNALCVT